MTPAARLGPAITAAFSMLVLAACSPEGRRPQTVTIGEDRHPVFTLTSLTYPYGDLHIAPDQGVFVDFARTESVVTCDRRGYTCLQWPFVFSFPDDGDPPAAGWRAAGYEFRVLAETERNFCGRARRAYLVEGVNETGWSTRVWYSPRFGVYAVMSGQARDGALVDVERAFITCERGLYERGWARAAGEAATSD